MHLYYTLLYFSNTPLGADWRVNHRRPSRNRKTDVIFEDARSVTDRKNDNATKRDKMFISCSTRNVFYCNIYIYYIIIHHSHCRRWCGKETSTSWLDNRNVPNRLWAHVGLLLCVKKASLLWPFVCNHIVSYNLILNKKIYIFWVVLLYRRRDHISRTFLYLSYSWPSQVL